MKALYIRDMTVKCFARIKARFVNCCSENMAADFRWHSLKWVGTTVYWTVTICFFLTLFLVALCLCVSFLPAGICESFRRFGPSDAVMNVMKLYDPRAFALVSQLLGLTVTAFTWLVSATDTRVRDISVGELVNWAYPKIYRYYFVYFLVSVSINIYIGNANSITIFWLPWAASACSGITATVITAYLMRLCYVLLLNTNLRRHVVYSYYRENLENALCRLSGYMTAAQWENTQSEVMEDALQWIVRSAKSAAARLDQEHETDFEALGLMCSITAKCLTGGVSESPVGQEHYMCLVAYHNRLFRSYLQSRPVQNGAFLDSVHMVEQVCGYLRRDIQDKGQRYIFFSRFLEQLDRSSANSLSNAALIAGFLRGILFYSEAGLEEGVQEMICFIDYLNLHRSRFPDAERLIRDLIWGTGMHLMLHNSFLEEPDRVSNTSQAFLERFCGTLLLDADRPERGGFKLFELIDSYPYSQTDRSQLEEQLSQEILIQQLYQAPKAPGSELLLLYVEWAFREEQGIQSGQYLQFAMKELGDGPSRRIFWLLCRRELLILWASKWENKQEG